MSSLPSPAPRVLIADDDEGIRQALRDLLGEEGMDVVGEASDGMGAVAAAKDLAPDVVLMDLRMPDLGGAEATTMIREALPTTQVIILSAYDDPALNRSAEEAGAYAYLVKGCSAGLVRDVLLEAYKLKQGLERRAAQP
jgi:DNA-binding NarL/FixJ family response regulator